MQRNWDRTIISAIIWIAAATALIAIAFSGAIKDGIWFVLLVAITFGSAAGATSSIWESKAKEAKELAKQTGDETVEEKGKRSSRTRLMQTINALDDEEADYLLHDIRRRMMEQPEMSEGEPVDLEQLLQSNKTSR